MDCRAKPAQDPRGDGDETGGGGRSRLAGLPPLTVIRSDIVKTMPRGNALAPHLRLGEAGVRLPTHAVLDERRSLRPTNFLGNSLFQTIEVGLGGADRHLVLEFGPPQTAAAPRFAAGCPLRGPGARTRWRRGRGRWYGVRSGRCLCGRAVQQKR